MEKTRERGRFLDNSFMYDTMAFIRKTSTKTFAA